MAVVRLCASRLEEAVEAASEEEAAEAEATVAEEASVAEAVGLLGSLPSAVAAAVIPGTLGAVILADAVFHRCCLPRLILEKTINAIHHLFVLLPQAFWRELGCPHRKGCPKR